MSSRKLPLRRRAPVVLGLFAFLLTAAALTWAAAGPQSAPEAKPKAFLPAFPRAEKARNPVTLQLQADESKVVGWVSGTRNHSGKSVTIKIGDRAEELTLDKSNSFTWAYKVEKAAVAEVTVGDKKDGLRGSVALLAPAASPGPC